MARKTQNGTPKVQRGISISQPLYALIAAEADKYGRTWNETVELVLSRAFLPQDDLPKSIVQMRTPRAEETAFGDLK